MNGTAIAITSLAKDALRGSAGAECRGLLEFPALTGAGLTRVPATSRAMVAEALLRLVERTHARLAVLSIRGLGHLGAGDAGFRRAFPPADAARTPVAGYLLGSPDARARRLPADPCASARCLAYLDEPGVQAVLDFIGVLPGHPLLEPIRTRSAAGHSDELGEVALLAVVDAAITLIPKWAVTLVWTSGGAPRRGELEALFRALSESLDLAPSNICSRASHGLTFAPAERQPRLPLLPLLLH